MPASPPSKVTSTSTSTTTNSSALPIDDGDEFNRTKILLLGARKTGKTTIKQVLFDNLTVKKSFYLDPTSRFTKHKVDSIIPLEIWDCPGDSTLDSLGVPLSTFSTIIFVIDILGSYNNPISRVVDAFVSAFQQNQDVNLELFVHKAEAQSEDYRNENFRLIQARVLDELADLSPITLSAAPGQATPPPFEPEQLPIVFHLTSCHDHTLREAFSRVLTRLLAPACLPFLEELLNAFCGSSHASKAFLFDIRSKVFVATDSSPVDAATLSLCCDYVHMLNSFGGLYESSIASSSRMTRPNGSNSSLPSPATASPNITTSSIPSSPRSDPNRTRTPTSAAASRAPTPTHTAAPPTTTYTTAVGSAASSSSSRPNTATADGPQSSLAKPAKTKPPFYPSSSTTLTPYNTLTYHAITPQLALVALLPTHVWETKRGLVEYNVVFFREGVQEVLDVEQDSRRRKKSSPK